ncbi:MAG: HYR domain-containing protein [Verrucomicrobiota bacterium]
MKDFIKKPCAVSRSLSVAAAVVIFILGQTTQAVSDELVPAVATTNLTACTCINEVVERVKALSINEGSRGNLLQTLEKAGRQIAICHVRDAGKRLAKFVKQTRVLVKKGAMTQATGDSFAVCASTIDLCGINCDLSTNNLPPVVFAKPLVLSADSQCEANPPASQFDNGSVDPDGVIGSRSVTPPGPYPLGETEVTYTVVDNGGAFSSAVTTVRVEDTTGPIVSNFSPNFLVTIASGQSSGTAIFPPPTVTDSCSGVASVSFAPPSGSVFPLGITPAALIVIDGDGNTNQISFNVVVVPNAGGGGGNNLPPVAIAQPVTIAADANCQALVTANQVDNHSFDPDGAIVNRVVQPFGPFAVGTVTPVTLTVTDNQGAMNSTVTTVTVLDLTPPTFFTLPRDITVTQVPGQSGVVVNYPALNVSDNCSAVDVSCTPPSGTAFGLGTNLVTCAVFDGAGNGTSTTFRVIMTPLACDTIPGLSERVRAIPLTGNFNGGRRNSMLKKLQKAQLNVTLKRLKSADYLLKGFILSCSIYQNLNVLDFETAGELIICATNIQNHLYDEL